MTVTLPHNNIHDKCTRNVENISSIYFNTQMNENIVNETDTVHEMSKYNDTLIENVNYIHINDLLIIHHIRNNLFLKNQCLL